MAREQLALATITPDAAPGTLVAGQVLVAGTAGVIQDSGLAWNNTTKKLTVGGAGGLTVGSGGIISNNTLTINASAQFGMSMKAGSAGIGYAIVTQYYHQNGTQLWQVGSSASTGIVQSFEFFDTIAGVTRVAINSAGALEARYGLTVAGQINGAGLTLTGSIAVGANQTIGNSGSGGYLLIYGGTHIYLRPPAGGLVIVDQGPLSILSLSTASVITRANLAPSGQVRSLGQYYAGAVLTFAGTSTWVATPVTVTFTSTGGTLLYHITIAGMFSTANTVLYAGLAVDGVLSWTFAYIQNSIINASYPVGATIQDAGRSAGTHTVTVWMNGGAGTCGIYNNSASILQVTELNS